MLAPSESGSSVPGRTKDPDATRARLVECAFQEIYEHGYSGASLDRLLSKTNLTKGALYHHFGSKADLAHAVIDELIRGWVVDLWLAPLKNCEDPVTILSETGRRLISEMPREQMECGCPLNNLTQELANTDQRFREHLLRVFHQWREGIAESLERGQARGTVRTDIDATATATFIVSTIEGLAGTAKSTRDRALVVAAGKVLLQFLETLKPVAPRRVAARRRATLSKRRAAPPIP